MRVEDQVAPRAGFEVNHKPLNGKVLRAPNRQPCVG